MEKLNLDNILFSQSNNYHDNNFEEDEEFQIARENLEKIKSLSE